VSAELDPIQELFVATQGRWRQAVQAHRMAAPDAGFSRRLAALSSIAREEADVCRKAAAAGYSWPSHTSTVEQPYELRPGTGRRGPQDLWQKFDSAVEELNRAAAGTDLIEVASAHELLADAAGDLAMAVEHEDRASGLLPQLDLRERRSA
jgi:hypothetical protein